LKFDVEGVAVFVISVLTSDRFLKNSLKTEVPDNFGCKGPFLKNYPSGESWIAIIQRGNCRFNEKIENAMKLNASGVLIYDSENTKTLKPMLIDLFEIPSVFTFGWKGKHIANLTHYHEKVFVNLTKGSHCRRLPFIKGEKPKAIIELPPLTTNFTYNVDKISPSNGSSVLYCGTLTAWSEFNEKAKQEDFIWDWNTTRYVHNETLSYDKKIYTSLAFLTLLGLPVLMCIMINLILCYMDKNAEVQVIIILPCKHCFVMIK